MTSILENIKGMAIFQYFAEKHKKGGK